MLNQATDHRRTAASVIGLTICWRRFSPYHKKCSDYGELVICVADERKDFDYIFDANTVVAAVNCVLDVNIFVDYEVHLDWL